MKILITGASGYIARMLISELRGHELLLWSRSKPVLERSYHFYQSADLTDFEWWSSAVIPAGVDVVVHLAESVKTYVNNDIANLIVSSHCVFLENACTHSALVIYPDTAYKYDARLGRRARAYCEIKSRVNSQLNKSINFISPIIHPVLESKGALAKLIYFQSKIPSINLFCSFNSTLPCLTSLDLKSNFKRIIFNKNHGGRDWFSINESIANLMNVEGRVDSHFISKTFKSLLSIFSFLPIIRLLLQGRIIAEKSDRVGVED